MYDQFYLYAKKIKKVPQVGSPTKKHVISSPRVLSRFSPVASLIKRGNSCKRSSTPSSRDAAALKGESKGDPNTPKETIGLRKSTFTTQGTPKNRTQIELSDRTGSGGGLQHCHGRR